MEKTVLRQDLNIFDIPTVISLPKGATVKKEFFIPCDCHILSPGCNEIPGMAISNHDLKIRLENVTRAISLTNGDISIKHFASLISWIPLSDSFSFFGKKGERYRIEFINESTKTDYTLYFIFPYVPVLDIEEERKKYLPSYVLVI